MSRRSVAMISLTAVFIVLSVPIWAYSQDNKQLSAQAIIDKMLEGNDSIGISSGSANLMLMVQDRTGTKRVKNLTVRSKKINDAVRTNIKLTAPKELRGLSFLFAENKKGEDNVWMYLPSFGVTRRIEGSQKKGAFLGSHLSFADLESRDFKGAVHERLPDEKIGKTPVFVISTVPRDTAHTDYGKIVTYVRKSDYTSLKVRFFAKDKKMETKTMFVEKLGKTKKGETYTKQMTLRVKSGGFTTIMIKSIDETSDIPNAVFSKEQLGK